jgi:hypothetical protein
MLVGGIVGYISYAPIAAWLTFKRIFIEKMGRRLIEAGFFMLILVYLAFAFLPFYCAAAFTASVPLFSELSWVYNLQTGFILAFGYCVVFGIFLYILDISLRDHPIIEAVNEAMQSIVSRKDYARDELVEFLFWMFLNPVSVGLIVIPILIPLYMGLVTAIKAVEVVKALFWELRRSLRIFFREILPETIVAIHSEAWLVAAIAAALGAAAGFFTGSVLAGAAIGGVLGLADIAFLRRRLLAWAASRAAA